ncbi:MAG: DegV family protein [Eubacteriales bacterium]|nr:DegV family protein [Eubacteriales bacterium]MDD5910410.1 DegV family protein [Clostridiales bacterium]MDY3822797.1 DegV family protein [Eubacteriales bacterium]MDY5367113.1 DegV family protein [Eubacteriales bacterium]MDY5624524.1 DegV family protein [Eubacteriales bacterium]
MSKEYVIMTDSSCDLPQELADQLGLEVLPLEVMADGKNYRNWLDGREIGFKEFYKLAREGKELKTSAVNTAAFEEKMEKLLKEGKDILYIGFSSGLSTTYNSGEAAARELREKYPDRKIYTVDTLAASLGQGMIIYYAAKKKEAGATIEEVRDFVENEKLHMCHWFTVDDLNYLKRGGRISAATAAVGTMLSIKPVMHMDNEGHLVAVGKARGRKAALCQLLDTMGELGEGLEGQTTFICHSDCMDDAQYVASQMKERFGVAQVNINWIGPVIGAHTGPGTIGIFFWGRER